MPQCPTCNAAVWVGQQYCTTCTNPLPQTDEEKYLCPHCGIPLAAPQEICQSCKVTQEISEIPAAAPARTWRLPLKVPAICMGAGLLSVALLLVFLFHKSLGPSQLLKALSSPAASRQTPAASPIPASEKTFSVSKVAAVQKSAAPPAPAASSPPQVTAPTLSLPRYFVNTHELTVRNGPTMSALSITTLNFKDEVELLDTADGWGRVRDMRRNTVGWAYMQYLQRLAVSEQTPAPPPRPASETAPAAPRVVAVQKHADPSTPAVASPPAVTTPTPAWPRYFVNTHALTVRDGPDSSAGLITILDSEDEVELLETSDGWGRVRERRRKIAGWANMRYLQRSEVSEQTPAIAASETVPAAPKVAAVQKLAVPSAPAVSSPPAVTGPTPVLPRYFVNTHALIVRDRPDSSAGLITILDSEDEVELLETSGGWGRVRVMGRKIVGWANMRYLQRLAVDGPKDVPRHQPSAPKELESISAKAPRVM